MNNLLIQTIDLSKTFQDGDLWVPVIDGINFSVQKAERIAIIGPSGSGKSTLLHLLGGLDKPTKGDVFLLGKKLSALKDKKRAAIRNQALGFIYQFHHLLPEFSALENIMLPGLIAKSPQKQVKEKAYALLEEVGLSNRFNHKPTQLSGGERQRVAIARALINQPQCLLADEPTGNLDSESAENVFNLLNGLTQKHQISQVIVTHDLTLAKKMDSIYRLENGALTKLD